MIKRQLTYSIPLQAMSPTVAIQTAITKTAIVLNGQCLINYESLHTLHETFSTMIVKLIVEIDQCDYVHREMQKLIRALMDQFSPDTDVIQVTDIPVMARNFHCEEL